ncbi:MAG: hypothetical protein L7W41_02455 [Alphaproteobacteria bacterium]|nr:hypothetical protein [Alphaproteobacteria bacterium]
MIINSNLTRPSSNGKQLSQIGSHGHDVIARMCHDAAMRMCRDAAMRMCRDAVVRLRE